MKALRIAFGETLVELGGQYPNLLVLDGDLANSTMTSIFDQAYPDRFIQTGIAEQNMVGMAAGLAHTGFIPWMSTFAVFLTHRGLDPLRMLVAQTRANVKVAGAYSGMLSGLTGKSHQDVQDLAIMRAMPEMVVLAPADAVETRTMMRWATDYDGPVYIRLARDPSPVLLPDEHTFEPGLPLVLRRGADVTLIATGVQTPRTLDAAALLAGHGVEATVLHVGCLKPLDESALVAEAGTPPLVVTVEEHSVIGGLGGLVAEVLSTHAPQRVVRIGVDDVFGESAPNDFLLNRYGLTPERVAERVLEELS